MSFGGLVANVQLIKSSDFTPSSCRALPKIMCGHRWFGQLWRTCENVSNAVLRWIRLWSVTNWAAAPVEKIQDQRIVNWKDHKTWSEICHLAATFCIYTTHCWDISQHPSSVQLLTVDLCQLRQTACGESFDWKVVKEMWQGVCFPPCSTALLTASDSAPGQQQAYLHFVTNQVSILLHRSRS